MVCHGELARLKPHPRYLTGFYVMVSLGGAVGGLFVGLVAPNFFHAYYEFPIGLALCAALVVVVLIRAPLASRWSRALAARDGGSAATLVLLRDRAPRDVQGYRVVERNFYGQLRVDDDGDPERRGRLPPALHGMINHGEQMLRAELSPRARHVFLSGNRDWAGHARAGRRTAAHRDPGAGLRHAGGLRQGRRQCASTRSIRWCWRSRERNSLICSDTPAKVEMALGDGRLSLEREPSQQFDMLVMDAFSGDSVPVHLITREAFETYFRHLKPDGILAVNISNTLSGSGAGDGAAPLLSFREGRAALQRRRDRELHLLRFGLGPDRRSFDQQDRSGAC